MKKIIAFLLCMIMALPLFSCESDGADENTSAERSDAEMAMEMYEAAINDEICVFDESLCEVKLTSCRFPTNGFRVDESIIQGKAIIDVDNDGINEYIIRSSAFDSIILHYYDGRVYAFAFEFESFNNLKSDGSFYWNGPYIYKGDYSDGVYDRGGKRIRFDGAKLICEDIYKTVHDEQYNPRYYIGDEEVSSEDMTEYLQGLSTDFVQFTPFEAHWYNLITEEDAIRIASEYWDVKPGDIDESTGFRLALFPVYSTGSNYRIALKWYVGPNYSTVETIEINAFTGEIVTSDSPK